MILFGVKSSPSAGVFAFFFLSLRLFHWFIPNYLFYV